MENLGAGERSIAFVRIWGAHGVARVFVLGLISQPPSASGSSTCSRACQSCLTESKWDQRKPRNRHHQRDISAAKKHTGREVRSLGALEHPGALPRSTLRPAWWKWRKVYGSPWKHPGEHINVLELGAVVNGVLWRLRSASNIHSKGVLATDSMVILGAFGSQHPSPCYSCTAGRTSVRQMVPIAEVHNHQRSVLGKARRKRLRANVGLLRDRSIAPWTLVQYRALTAAFFSFCSNAGSPNHTQLPKWIFAFANSSSTHGKKVIPVRSRQMRALASCIVDAP